MKRNNKVLESLNEVYTEQNPSTYLRNYKEIKKFIDNRKQFLHDLKLPSKIFKDASLIDFGCGSGQNTIVYNWLGAKTTLVEYNKKSFENTSNLFKKFSKSKYKLVRSDIFKFKSNKKYEFVLSNGVIHHTKDPKKNIDICCKHLKKGGFFILGWGELYGFFQRNVQRLILYSISKNKEDIIKYSKILFKDHLSRSVKFSGRTIDEVIFDTYINPKIDAVSLGDILQVFSKNGLNYYSSYEPIKKLINLSNPNNHQFNLIGNSKIMKKFFEKKEVLLNDFYNFSLSNQNTYENRYLSHYTKMNGYLKKIVNSANNTNFLGSKMQLPIKEVNNLKKNLIKTKKEEILDISHNKIFLDEIILIFKILNSKNDKLTKFIKIHNFLKKSKKIFKKYSGVGMNYIVGYKK